MSSENWYFTADTNAKGYTYIKAYQTEWDPVRKRSRSINRRHVGRLHEDGHVTPSPGFLASFPQYAGYTLYYGANKQLVDEMTYRQDFPDSPGPKRDADDLTRLATLQCGMTWAAMAIAEESGLYRDLVSVFGEKNARGLLDLAIYKLDAGNAMASFEPWWQSVYLKSSAPMSDQRISELLSSVTPGDFDAFFSRRHEAKLKNAKEKEKVLSYALDNTSISTHSRTIADAAYGYAKRDPELKQINYTFVCDQSDGEIVFAYTYEGSINDATALSEIIYRMRDARLNLENVTLVTDRGYSSLWNIQKMINLEMKYIQGMKVTEDSIKKEYDKARSSLQDIAFYDSDLGVYACTYEEPWYQQTDSGQLYHKTHVHLYRFPGAEESEMKILAAKATEILRYKQSDLKVPPDLWRTHGRFVVEKVIDGERKWIRNDNEIRKAIRYAGCFVIRSNAETNPFKAFSIYNKRNAIEVDFNQYKNWVDGSRLRCTGTSYLGKLFVCTLSASLRLMMLHRAHTNSEKLGIKIPHNSMDHLFSLLRNLLAERRRDANAWVVRTAAKKQRDMLALLGLKLPPKVLRC